jgi:hypothetical protein
MINQADEVPVTYLNKGQVYSVLIVDTTPSTLGPIPVQYRTTIRISFEDGQQQQITATRWNLWKEARGAKEAHQRGGKLQGVEYVEITPITENDGVGTKVNLETASLDEFSVLWVQGSSCSANCRIAVRFNFLSTDFSHSKGVKGIPSRLCAKTEVLSTDFLQSTLEVPEICFCGVQVFRDHGAERKSSNDVTHVKKTIDKLEQKITEAETRRRDPRERKQRGSIAMGAAPTGPAKVTKRKRTESMLSASPTEDDLYYKLQTMRDMFASTRPVSVLNLRGQDQDSTDLHRIQLTSGSLDLVKVEREESAARQQRTSSRSLGIAGTSALMGTLLTLGSAYSREIGSSGCNTPGGAELPTHGQRGGFQPVVQIGSELQQLNPQHLPSPPDQSVEVQMPQQDKPGTSARGIEALEVNSSSIFPPERPMKPGTFSNLYTLGEVQLTIF